MKNIALALSSAFLLLFLASANIAGLQDVEDPPFQGEALQGLLGQRAESPAVAALCEWAGAPAPTWETEMVNGKGIIISFKDSRVSKIYLEIESQNMRPRWIWDLPMGLTRSTKIDDIGLPQWKGRYTSDGDLSRSHYRRSEMNRSFQGRQISGYEGEVMFGTSGPIRHVIIKVSPENFWFQLRAIIQEIVPASKFDPNGWLGLLGVDIASGTGDTLAAWVNMPVDGTSSKRAGMSLELSEHRWIDTIALDSSFQGAFPFGLTAAMTLQDLTERFGEGTPDPAAPKVRTWKLSSPKNWPLRIEFDARDKDLPRLVLRCVRQEVRDLDAMLFATGKPSDDLVAELVKFWNVAQEDSASFKGRVKVVQGLFGPIESWNTSHLLSGVLGGMVEESAGNGLFSDSRKIEYLVRSYPGQQELAAAQLDSFGKALSGRLQGTELPERTNSKDGKTSELLWAIPGAGLGELLPELSLEARSSAGGSELFLTIVVPIE